MSSTDILDALRENNIDLNSLSIDDLESLEKALRSKRDDLAKTYDSMAGSMPDGGYVLKFNDNGQWDLVKDMTPANTLNYKKINEPKKSPKPTTINYSGESPTVEGKQWKSSDTQKGPKMGTKSSAREAKIKEDVRAGKLIDDRAKSSSKIID